MPHINILNTLFVSSTCMPSVILVTNFVFHLFICIITVQTEMKENTQMSLDAINILKGLAYSQLELEDERARLTQSGYFNQQEVFRQIDRRETDRVQPQDIINFLGVHRIAANERECQFLIWTAGSNEPHLTFSQFVHYLSNGHPQTLNHMQSSGLASRLLPADELLRNNSERELAKLWEKEIEYYRSIEQLREQFVKTYGFQFQKVLAIIDRDNTKTVSLSALGSFIQARGVQFSREEFQAIVRKVRGKDPQWLSYKELMRAFSPFEPLSFPTYRKQSNLQRAVDYINEQVKLLDIDTYVPPEEQAQNARKTKTGFQKVLDEFRNPATQGTHLSSKYFYDKNYYGQLRQYKATFYDPNKDVKKKLQNQIVGPQYHDHFFSDYYLHLEQRNKSEHYYNKFGKRYAFDNPIAKTLDSK